MSAPLTEHNLFSALREYTSRLEVQYMIEEEVKKFQEKVLPRVLSEALTTASHAAAAAESTAGGDAAGATSRNASSSPPFNTEAPSHATATPNSEWVRTFLKAHVDDVLSRQLPPMIVREVQQQLRNANGGGLAASSSSGSPPGGESSVPPAAARARAGLPPLPPSPHPSRSPPRETTPVPAARSTPEHRGDGNRDVALLAPAADDEGRRQRKQILNAIADIEHQLQDVQRELNEVVHQQRLSRCRFEYLCETLQGTGLSPAAESTPSSLCVALEQALDNRKADVVRARLAAILQGLLPPPTEPHSGRGAAIHNEAALTPGNSSSLAPQDGRLLSASLASAKSYAVPSSGHNTPPQLPDRSPSCLRGDVQSPPLVPSGAVEAPTPLPRNSSRMAPVNSAPASARSLTDARHGDASGAAAALSKAHRSITTRGTAASAATTKAVSLPPPPSALVTTDETAPPPLPVLRQQSHARPDAGGAVSRPAPLPQVCVDPSMRERAGRDTHATASMGMADGSATAATTTVPPANCTDPSNACLRSALYHSIPSSSINSIASSREAAAAGGTPRAVVLGINAMDILPGVLPGALSRQGAVRVESVTPLQLAERAGLCRGDVLLSVANRPVGSCEQLRAALTAVRATQPSVALEVYRHATQEIVFFTLQL
ncbi:hypothetical protein, unknown function [Leishmania mexicana MHOM/GT/2001/U1103]|uniref:PDZ domain-containing protein n=1 Tax=Leishmania mexicana (strain MHOM/GT/2001/U1103) TaxID=929439 RepID=E9AN26_LEIMU|nr:hypothetical protein, unknown function [Leishmania mexicana MHOM/GT/2001/U1103]CBZ24331.1 hypothetical protein, unknown function [Leishmania mexicana MHOM/GT/2001/U1103]